MSRPPEGYLVASGELPIAWRTGMLRPARDYQEMAKLVQSCREREAKAAPVGRAEPGSLLASQVTAASCLTRAAAMQLVPGLQLAELPHPDEGM